MKAGIAQFDRALRALSDTRFFLFHGPDEAGSRALAAAVAKAAGQDAERIDLAGAALKADPARLADEAGAISLFGGARHILVEAGGDEVLAALEALVAAPSGGNPVVVLAGTLKPTSKLLKLAHEHPHAIAVASYVPDERELGRLVSEMAHAAGLTLGDDVARRIAAACAGNRAVAAQEIAKFALYLDADAARPKPLDHDVVDAVGVAAEDGDLTRMVDAVTEGAPTRLEEELARLRGEGVDGVPLVRAVARRIALLARLRAEVETGRSPAAVMASAGKAIFWKERDIVARQLGRWRGDLLAKAMGRLIEAERQAKASAGAGAIAVDEELFAICRQAARLG